MKRLSVLFGSRQNAIIAGLTLVALCVGGTGLLKQHLNLARSISSLNETIESHEAVGSIRDFAQLGALLNRIETQTPENNVSEQDLRDAVLTVFAQIERIQESNLIVVSPEWADKVKRLDTLRTRLDGISVSDLRGDQHLLSDIRDRLYQARDDVLPTKSTGYSTERDSIGQTIDPINRLTWMFSVAISLLAMAGGCVFVLLWRQNSLRTSRDDAVAHARFLTLFDPLTELPNRTQFRESVEQAIGQDPTNHGAVAYIDLDNFRQINETHGHETADIVLKNVAKALSKTVSQYEGIAARLSGDELGAYLRETDTKRLYQFGEGLVAASRLLRIGEKRIVPSVSIGIACCKTISGEPARYDDILRRADFALHVSKDAGGGTTTVYDAVLDAKYSEHRAILDDLPRAIQRDELELYLQPKVTLETEKIYGFEALVRWRRKDRLIRPDMFIRLAEDAGLVTEIDLHILEKAIQALADWNRSQNMSLSVSVNLSALHFRSRYVVARVQDALERSGLEPGLLTLEITESEQLGNWHKVRNIMSQLRDLGCQISIDDFGTGYSSLAYLRAMPANELKIDRSLIDQIEDRSEVRFLLDAIVEMARGLDLSVVVEGIETEEQAGILRDLGATKGQGFFYGRPIPVLAALHSTLNSSDEPFSEQNHSRNASN